MEFDQEHIRQLYLQKLTDSLTPEEERELENAMRYPAVRRMCRELDDLYASPEMQRLLREKPTSARWDELVEHAMTREEAVEVRNMGVRRWLMVASVLIMVTLGLYFLWPEAQQQSVNFSAVAQATGKSYDIRLRLSTGELVPLTGAGSQERIKAGKVQLSNHHKTLRYEHGEAPATQWNTLEVPAREDYTIVLSDGTEVSLNSASSLRFPFSFKGSNTREVEVRGEAFFKVAPDASKPFIVRTHAGDVQVLGTSFNINTYESGKLKASLVEGSVKTSYRTEARILRPGEQAINQTSGRMTVQAFDKEEVLSWMKGVYYFNSSPMIKVAEVVDRWYDVQMVFDNPAIAGYKYDGKLDKTAPLEDFLEVLRLTKRIEYRMEDGMLHLF
ncbi:FecR family protein [Chitinophaga cymbidii]|uniref:Iron dicitrate transporter FecR n=1 Tax=Chitinophaga cymbidii TaxID=1096750 RepID=A0A512REG6_9BACT|nr:FecR domain-containing protein [Chitinophaga cymbidii]GEP94093.1 iron dicitrate transporter FecR [Chitinophaga cymbidii]